MIKDKILIVGDKKNIFDPIQNILGATYQLLHADNEASGLSLYTEHMPLLIILDLFMSAKEGLTLLTKMEVSTENPHAIIILPKQVSGQMFDDCYRMGVTSFLHRPFNAFEMDGLVKQSIAARKNYLKLTDYAGELENTVQERTLQLQEQVQALEQTKTALSQAMGNLLVVRVIPGVFWLQIPEAGLYILCGCPGEAVKHLMQKGLIHTVDKEGITCETGPNVILLSEFLVQNGGFSNLAEFPVLQMLYRQGMILPGHPNNTGVKPMLIGSSSQVRAQMEYIHRGNYGLVSKEELLENGVDEITAENMMKIKLKFAFGSIQPPTQLLDTLEIDETPRPIRHGVTVCRIGSNRYQFAFQGRTADIDLNLPPNTLYPPAYLLGNHRFKRQYFAVLHRGEGDGWDASRPSMGSVIMFQGRIYLVDAAPGVFYSMMALGIDISEVEGIFHTHGHDDHFGGLPALIHSGHRLKYYATPPVRAAVAKKFTALMSMKEEKFAQFFEICDLTSDVWNDCNGLEVKPIFSPHPTETNILLFRALDGEGHKSYAHWADLSSFRVLDSMVGEGPDDLSADFIQKVKEAYLQPVNIKKLDIGGGMIHGCAADFREDRSDRLIMSHVDRLLTLEEMEIGSETSFGAMDILIPGDQDYVYQRAFHYLHHFFSDVAAGQIHMLLNAPIFEYNVGTILHRKGDSPDFVDMVVAGTVTYLELASGVRNHLAFGSFIGIDIFFGKQSELEGTYRALSHCSVIRFSPALLHAFLENNGLYTHVESLLDRMRFLLKSWLFGEQTTFSILGTLAQSMERCSFPAGATLVVEPVPSLYLIIEGEIILRNAQGSTLDVIKAGGFIGEHTYLNSSACGWTFHTIKGVELYQLHGPNLLNIPIIHWKILEIYERRCKSVAFSIAQKSRGD